MEIVLDVLVRNLDEHFVAFGADGVLLDPREVVFAEVAVF